MQKGLVKECALSVLLNLYSRFPGVEGLESDTKAHLVSLMGLEARKRARSQTGHQGC
jgi:hypothetical protein